jgi:hypothetical protein
MSTETPPRIENWACVCDSDPYKAPEQQAMQITGNVYFHPRVTPGNPITTSAVVGRTVDGHIKTRNSIYALGRPAADYEAQFPGALERLLKTLPVV